MGLFINDRKISTSSGIPIKSPDRGNLNINSNGTFDVSEYKFVSVDIPSNNCYTENNIPDVNSVKEGDLCFYRPVLDNCTWEEISQISLAGKARDYFKIGDCKAVTISGTVGLEPINSTYYVYIIDFDHDVPNTIDFGTFKTSSKDGIDICLVDTSYDTQISTIEKFHMNNTNVNTTGWVNSHMRTVILGSDSNPTNPTPNTLLAALPSDLRAVMKPMTIYTDNTGGTLENTSNSNVTTTIDYLPLLSEFEVFGEIKYANIAEQNYQRQYEYYNLGNLKTKYKNNEINSYAFWWLRSPYILSGAAPRHFCVVPYFERCTYNLASYSYGVAPIFRV